MTPIDVQDHDWPDGRVVWLLAAVAALGIAAFFVRDAAAWLVAWWRGPAPVRPVDDAPRDLVPREQLDAALTSLRAERAHSLDLALRLDEVRWRVALLQREQAAAAATRATLATLATLTTPTDA